MSERVMQDDGQEEGTPIANYGDWGPPSLIRLARKGDPNARELLWASNRRWVAAIILAHRPRSIEIEDLMQEVAVRFVSKLHTLRDAGSFRPWLRRIAINACRGAARRERPSLRLAAGEQVQPGEIAQPRAAYQRGSVEVDTTDAASRLYEQLMTLPSEYREPLLLRCVQELTYQQISDILELPVTTVETRLARGRRMLRAELDDDCLMDDVGQGT